MTMNAFRLTGDTLNMSSILLFLYIVGYKGNGVGISSRSQEFYLLVFCTRYLDLFTTFYSVYNSVIKVLYIGLSAAIVYILHYVEPAKSTYNPALDLHTASTKSILLPPLVLASVVHICGSLFEESDLLEYLWTFSILLESVAMIPQLQMFQQNRDILNPNVRVAIAMKGSYRFLYILNWIHRAHTEPHYRHHWLVYMAAVIQVASYTEFFSYHISQCARLSQHAQPSGDEASPLTELLLQPGEGGGGEDGGEEENATQALTREKEPQQSQDGRSQDDATDNKGEGPEEARIQVV